MIDSPNPGTISFSLYDVTVVHPPQNHYRVVITRIHGSNEPPLVRDFQMQTSALIGEHSPRSGFEITIDAVGTAHIELEGSVVASQSVASGITNGWLTVRARYDFASGLLDVLLGESTLRTLFIAPAVGASPRPVSSGGWLSGQLARAYVLPNPPPSFRGALVAPAPVGMYLPVPRAAALRNSPQEFENPAFTRPTTVSMTGYPEWAGGRWAARMVLVPR